MSALEPSTLLLSVLKFALKEFQYAVNNQQLM